MLDTHYYDSPLGKLTLASNGIALVGLWFEGQKYFGNTLDKKAQEFETLHFGSTNLESNTKSKNPKQRNKIFDFQQPKTPSHKHKPCGIHFRESNMAKGIDFQNHSAEVFAQTCKWLDEYFSAKIPNFTLPLAVCTSVFRQKVWEILLSIPYGKTMTYGEIAQILARQKDKAKMSARAVGTAVGHNPIALIIPCHRVIGSKNTLTGYAAGVDKKEYLLRLEKIYC